MVQKEVNGVTAYWVQLTATAVTTGATCNAIRQNAVHLTDYVLDPGTVIPLAPARVKRIVAGFLSAAEEVKVSFDKTTWTPRRFSIAKSAYQQGAARLEIYPEAGRGEKFQIVIPKMLLKPNGSISLDDTKWLETPMTLEVLDNYTLTPDYPYGYIEYLT